MTGMSTYFLTMPALLVAVQVAWTCSVKFVTRKEKLFPSCLTGMIIDSDAELDIVMEVDGNGLPMENILMNARKRTSIPSAEQVMIASSSFTRTRGLDNCKNSGTPRKCCYSKNFLLMYLTVNIHPVICLSAEPQAVNLSKTDKF